MPRKATPMPAKTLRTKRERAVMKEWEDHTLWEFMSPYPGESFYDALHRNRRWLEDRTTEALCIGDDIDSPEDIVTA